MNSITFKNPFEILPFNTEFSPNLSLSPFYQKVDSAILKLLKECNMLGGMIELEYSCNPSFLYSLLFEGKKHHIIFAKFCNKNSKEQENELSALGVRSTREIYLSGKPQEVSYLHHLRIHPKARRGFLLSQGYSNIRKIAHEFPTACTLTSILAENSTARKALENSNPRANLPKYFFIGKYCTSLIPLKGPGERWPFRHRHRILSSNSAQANLNIRFLEPNDHKALEELFHEFGRQNDGTPVLRPGSLLSNSASPWLGLQITDFLGAFNGNKLIGALGLWNQTPWKQIIARKFHPAINFLRFFLSFWRPFASPLPLISEGSEISHILFDPWIVNSENNPLVMRKLLEKAIEHLRNSKFLFAAWGAPVDHPVHSAISSFFYLPYYSRIYQVAWPENPLFTFDKTKFYIGLGSF